MSDTGWQIASRFQENDYVLIAPDGQRVGSFPSLASALAEMRRLQVASLDAPKPTLPKEAT